MDEFDRATAIEEAERDACIARVRNQTAMQPRGHCYNCEEPLDGDLLFCPGGECRDDFEKRMRKT